MKRRDFMKSAGALTAQVIGSSMIVTPSFLRSAQAQTGFPLDRLQGALAPSDGVIVVPGQAEFASYLTSFNRRMQLAPQVRLVGRNPSGVATAVAWARQNQVPFAIRSGGHSYEGFSQSTGLVIDTRLMKAIQISADSKSVRVASGCALGEVYTKLAAQGLLMPAGSCPTVGVSGHTLGGGYGLLARPFGLACDGLMAIEMVDSSGQILHVTPTENPDLFWALRGGGQGSFGIVTGYQFRTHAVTNVSTFSMGWLLPIERALHVMRTWQAWAPNAPDRITSIFRVVNGGHGMVGLHCAGQSIGTETELHSELKNLSTIEKLSSPLRTATMPFVKAFQHFAGGMNYESIFMKAKSDYLFAPMSDQGIRTLMRGLLVLPANSIAVMCDSYGGAIGKLANSDTAFAHRENAQYSMQYYSQWELSSQAAVRLANMRQLHDSMRPFVSGAAYLNYPDLDLKETYAKAYWGENLPRLQSIKKSIDGENFFKHAQSVPLA